MSQPVGKVFQTRIPTFSDDASIQEAFRVYHYGKDDYSETDPVEPQSIEGHFTSITSRLTAAETSIGVLGETFVEEISTLARPNVVTSEDPTVVPLTIRGLGTPTQPLQRWQTSNQTDTSAIYADGGAFFNNYVAVGNNQKQTTNALLVRIGSAAHKGVVVDGVVSQTGNLQEWTSTDGTNRSVRAFVNPTGRIFAGNGMTGVNTSEVVTVSGTQTITNKTFTSPTINSASIGGSTIETTNISGGTINNATITNGTVTSPTIKTSGAQTINDFRVRNIHASTAAPSGGQDGDVWIRYA
jgi:hypothetical protein